MIRRVLGDESLWLTAATLVAAVLASIPGLAGLATPVKTAIDSAAGAVSAVWVGGVAHRKATATKTTAAASTGTKTTGTSSVTPETLAKVVSDFAAQVDKLAQG